VCLRMAVVSQLIACYFVNGCDKTKKAINFSGLIFYI